MTYLIAFASVGAVFSKILYILVAIGVLLFMIMIHEFGHFTMGKLLGFKINEFAIGMGPKLFSHVSKKDGQLFSIRAIPLGGFCSFEGEDEEGNDKVDAFNNQKPWKRLIVLFAGAFFNFVSAVLIVIIAFSVVGEPALTISKIMPTSPNYNNSTIEVGDILYAIDGHKIYLINEYSDLVAQADDTMEITVFRPYDGTVVTSFKDGKCGEFLTFTVTKGEILGQRLNPDTKLYENYTYKGLGINANYYGRIDESNPQAFAEIYKVRYTFGQSLCRALPYCLRVGTVVLKTLGQLITGAIGLDAVGGPISTIDMVSDVVMYDFANVLYLITLISVNLAVFNLLPLPALDGSRIVFVLIEWIRGKPINRKVESIIHAVGIIVLLAFVILVDLLKWF